MFRIGIVFIASLTWACGSREYQDHRTPVVADQNPVVGDDDQTVKQPQTAEQTAQRDRETDRAAVMNVVGQLLASKDLGGELSQEEAVLMIPKVTDLIMGLLQGDEIDVDDITVIVDELLGDQLGNLPLDNWKGLLEAFISGDLDKVNPADFLDSIATMFIQVSGQSSAFPPDLVADLQGVISSISTGQLDPSSIEDLVNVLVGQLGVQVPMANILELVPFLMQMLGQPAAMTPTAPVPAP